MREDWKTRSIIVEKNYKVLGEIRKSAEEYNNFYIEIDQKLIESKTTPQNLKKAVENESTRFLKAFEPKTIMKYLGGWRKKNSFDRNNQSNNLNKKIGPVISEL